MIIEVAPQSFIKEPQPKVLACIPWLTEAGHCQVDHLSDQNVIVAQWCGRVAGLREIRDELAKVIAVSDRSEALRCLDNRRQCIVQLAKDYVSHQESMGSTTMRLCHTQADFRTLYNEISATSLPSLMNDLATGTSSMGDLYLKQAMRCKDPAERAQFTFTDVYRPLGVGGKFAGIGKGLSKLLGGLMDVRLMRHLVSTGEAFA